ncbi:MAG: MarP family serine protease [Actinobacteria bacterium]|nr:MarP family serine protease [Actinomycetota bacterium]
MSLVDLIIIGFVAMMAAWGFRQGAVMGVSSLVGFMAGVYLGTRLANSLLEGGNASPYAPLFALAAALVLGTIVAELTVALGFRFRVRFTSHTARRVDGTLGALLLASFALMIVWVGAAALNQTRMADDLRTSVRRSALVKELNAVLPPSGPLLSAISRIDPVPSIAGPSTNVAAPDPGTASDPDVRRAAASTVRVLGTACGYGVEGSGWVAAPGLIVTNAHVVAGQYDTTVQPGGSGTSFRATTVWFDSRNDLALLSAPSVTSTPLGMIPSTDKGTSVAIIGYPLNGALTISSARIGSTQSAISDDIYGNGPITRKMTSFRGLVRQGNSGGPLVDADGRVRSTVFASQSGSDNRRGYGVPGAIIQEALQQVDQRVPVSTGACS